MRTLLRGARARLPSGQEVAAALVREGIIEPQDCLSSSDLTRNTCDHSGSVLRDTGLEDKTPLFYYLLKEAEVYGSAETLGPVGSYIVAHVINEALETDPSGYMSVVGPEWKLPSWQFPSGSRGEINSLIGVIRVIGDAQLLPDCERKWRSLQPRAAVS